MHDPVHEALAVGAHRARVLDAEGHGDIQPELRTLTRQGRWAEMNSLVDDDVLASIVLRGTAAEIAAQLHRRYDGIADRVSMTIPHAVDLADLAALSQAFTRSTPEAG